MKPRKMMTYLEKNPSIPVPKNVTDVSPTPAPEPAFPPTSEVEPADLRNQTLSQKQGDQLMMREIN